MRAPALELREVTKTFSGYSGPVYANRAVSLSVKSGEIHAIVGENGAGKSTLMNVVFGLVPADSGTVLVDGQEVSFHSPSDAIEHGIGMIHQHFTQVPSFSVADNVVLGAEPTRHGLLDNEAITRQVSALGETLGIDTTASVPISQTPVGVQQRVEILKALYRGARILILDEPTAVLTPQETDALFDALRALRANGTTMVMITHKLPEVKALADRVTVMRDGEVVATFEHDEIDVAALANAMTGRDWSPDRIPRPPSSGVHTTVLAVEELECANDRGSKTVRSVSFDVHAGEVLAIAGIANNGQTELAEAILGTRLMSAGHIYLAGEEITSLSVKERRRRGVGYIPADRYRDGSAREANIRENATLGLHTRKPISRGWWFNITESRRWANQLFSEYSVRAEHTDAPMASLSGGNAQKVIVGRELAIGSRILIAEQPSRGADIGAAETIYERLVNMTANGSAVLLISLDLSEVLRLADRILVMYEGRIVAERWPETTDQRELGRLMTGLSA